MSGKEECNMLNAQTAQFITKDNTPNGDVDPQKILRILNDIIRFVNDLDYRIQQLEQKIR